jgi:hypothetical protein
MDIATITAAYEGLKASKQILGAAFDAKVDAEARPKVIAALEQLGNAQDALFSLREELFRLQSANQELRLQLTQAESWESRAKQYTLVRTKGGAVVYKFTLEPEHYACPSCYNKHEIHVLQDNRTMTGKFRCTGCEAEYPINSRTTPPPIQYNIDPHA